MISVNFYIFKNTEGDSHINDYEDFIYINGGVRVETDLENDSSYLVSNKFVYKMNLKSGNCENVAELKSTRYNHGSIVIGDNLCLIGGIDNSVSADTEIVSINSKVTSLNSTIPLMHNRRTSFGSCSFGACLFVAGGACSKVEATDKCEIYSTESCRWIEASSMNTKRCSFALIHFQDKIWAIGGLITNNKFNSDTIETYDLSENEWTNSDIKLLSKRYDHSAVVHNKKLFVIGGIHNQKALSSVEVYSSETNQFSFIAPMVQPRCCFGCSVFNNSLIVLGGRINLTQLLDSVEVYDFEKQVWSKRLSLHVPLSDISCARDNVHRIFEF